MSDYNIINAFQKKMDILKKNEDLTNYFFYRGEFTDEDIEQIEKIAQNYSTENGNVSGNINKDYRNSKISWIPKDQDSLPIYEKLIFYIKDANEKMWNFNLSSINEDLQYTVYNGEEKGHYDWHLDFGGITTSTRKLSMVIQLSDEEDYTGGELQFLINRSVLNAPKTKGTIILFPSYITHRVKAVESGVRKSLVLWVHGPHFQ